MTPTPERLRELAAEVVAADESGDGMRTSAAIDALDAELTPDVLLALLHQLAELRSQHSRMVAEAAESYARATEADRAREEAEQAAAKQWRYDWPEMAVRDPEYPNLLESARVIVQLADGTVTFDRAERFAEKTPNWFIHRHKVVAWQPLPAAFLAASGGK